MKGIIAWLPGLPLIVIIGLYAFHIFLGGRKRGVIRGLRLTEPPVPHVCTWRIRTEYRAHTEKIPGRNATGPV